VPVNTKKNLVVVEMIKGHKVEDWERKTNKMSVVWRTDGPTTNSRMVSTQILVGRVITITGTDIDIDKKMISWINAGKSGRELG
jgi:Tfp pilus assembly major pilin PilA